MTGTLYSVGVGPGDPELLTLKAARILAAAPAYAFFAKRGRPSHARTIAAPHLHPDAEAMRFDYPFTTEIPVTDPAYAAGMAAFFAKRGRPSHAHSIAAAHLHPDAEAMRFDYPFTTEIPVTDPAYAAGMAAFYQAASATIADRLDLGASVALLCEGDPFFYGSAMYVFDHLSPRYPHEAVPGITGMSGAWARAGTPMTHGDDVLTILPGTLCTEDLATRLAGSDAAVIMKVGRNLPKIRDALATAGRSAHALYVERGTMPGERIAPLADIPDGPAPYFSLILVPGRRGTR